MTPFRIGYHPNNLHLRLGALCPEPFKGLGAEFVFHPEGRKTGPLMREGLFDVGGTGSTPPLISQAEGMDVRYVAASAPRPANGALLVHPDSGLDEIAGMAGRKVALIDGSFHTYLLARVLDQAGLTLADVERHEMTPPEARAALAAREVDIWVAMAPMIELVTGTGEARTLALCGSNIPNRSTFWTLAQRPHEPARFEDFTAALTELGRRVAAQPDRMAALLAGDQASEKELKAWTRVVVGRDWTILPATDDILREQAQEAETLHRHGELAVALDPLLSVASAEARIPS
ncbi:ABC transporter [Pseudooceanicola sp. GBMRC 2024]|uniref:ABC transporter n=1 Tax=Pseudooceanicola albus TaxID=2692189 RepID=A0A6L7G546_9RHOB|nr:ABC transporter substrate-binding protein [Pseudooceanicola albus]MXN17763.1 ABC transporter [Pseudooceanicola albus]